MVDSFNDQPKHQSQRISKEEGSVIKYARPSSAHFSLGEIAEKKMVSYSSDSLWSW
jgi:hypothetical protein